MAYIHPFAALGDPTRRALFDRLKRRPHTVGELASFAKIRQPTASQHLRVLRAARLVNVRRDGTRRFYGVEPQGVEDLRRYVESLWDGVLAAYASAGSGNPDRRQRAQRKPRAGGRRRP